MTTSLDAAKRLVIQAVHQDTQENYEEAARCYREAVLQFRLYAYKIRHCERHPKVKSNVKEKIKLCSDRLKVLDRRLLQKADFTGLFKNVVDSELNIVKQDQKSEIQEGLGEIQKAEKHDALGEYSSALIHYERGKDILLNYETYGDEEEALKLKCLLIHDRVEYLRHQIENKFTIKRGEEGSLSRLEDSLGSRTPSISDREEKDEEETLSMKEVRSLSIAGSTHSLYPQCEIKRSVSIISGASDVGIGEESFQTRTVIPPLADLKKELRLSLSSLSSDEGLATVRRKPEKLKRTLETDTDAIQVLQVDNEDEDDVVVYDGDEVRLLESSFEEEKDDEITYVRANRIRSSNRYKGFGDNSSDSGISEERTVISSDGGSRNKSPVSDDTDCTELTAVSSRHSSQRKGSASYESVNDLPKVISEEIFESYRPSARERYEYIPPRAFARNRERGPAAQGCYCLLSCFDFFCLL